MHSTEQNSRDLSGGNIIIITPVVDLFRRRWQKGDCRYSIILFHRNREF